MELDRTRTKKERRRPLPNSFDMDTRREMESGSSKNNLAKNHRKRKTRTGVEDIDFNCYQFVMQCYKYLNNDFLLHTTIETYLIVV